MKQKCPTCRGAKQFMGLGMMIKDCGTCDGEGEVDYVKPEVTSPIPHPHHDTIIEDEKPPVIEFKQKYQEPIKRKKKG
jgi:hypothetical protein